MGKYFPLEQTVHNTLKYHPMRKWLQKLADAAKNNYF